MKLSENFLQEINDSNNWVERTKIKTDIYMSRIWLRNKGVTLLIFTWS